VRKGQLSRVVVRQVMDTPAPLPGGRNNPPPPRVNVARAVGRKPTPPRHILGAFQFSVQVKTAAEILPVDERTLTLIERVAGRIPLENRWYPVFQRYIQQLGGRVTGLGGGRPHPHPHPEPPHGEERIGYEGKVSGVLFDRFGDFEGFWLDTEDGKRRFRSREKEIEELVREAWERRIPILVIAEKEERQEPQTIVLLRPPADR
jgi:hypothetical protein